MAHELAHGPRSQPARLHAVVFPYFADGWTPVVIPSPLVPSVSRRQSTDGIPCRSLASPPSKRGRLAADGQITATHDPSLTFPSWHPIGACPARTRANGTPALPAFPPSSCSSHAATVSLLRAYRNDHDSDHWTLLSRQKRHQEHQEPLDRLPRSLAVHRPSCVAAAYKSHSP